MSNPIVQHISATGLNPISVTLTSPVTKGNLILLGFMDGGEETSLSTSMISDSLSCSWNVAVQQHISVTGTPWTSAIFYAIAPATGTLTVTLTDVQFDLTNLHVYEVAGYNALDVTGTFSDLTGATVTSRSVTTGAVTNFYDEFVFAIYFAEGDGFHNPATWAGQAGNEGTETAQQSNGIPSTFSEGFEVVNRIKQKATATLSSASSFEIPSALVATFYNTSNAAVPASPSLTVAPTLTPLFSDGFNRSNVSPLAAPWAIDAESDHGLQIASDLCLAAVQTPSPLAVYTGIQLYEETLPADCFASVTLGAAIPSDAQFGIKIRATDNGGAPATWPGYTLYIIGGEVWELVGALGGFAIGSGLTSNSGDVFTLAAVGSSVYALQNGIVLGGFTDVAVASGGTALLLQTDASGHSVEISNWVVGSCAVSPAGLTGTFLGSVKVLGSAPAGRSNPFLGTVRVVGSAPAGVNNPYLGSVVLGAPSGSQTNPNLGEVVIVGSAPAGASDPFLGTVTEG